MFRYCRIQYLQHKAIVLLGYQIANPVTISTDECHKKPY